ncbi:MFS transporter [Actinosynnema sp. NPDC059335]|uniref:MFS transporter n=1 Tax=Actinosynnema sp. NPDC059335 TaxID=3346804 RepID=UPI0036717105
MDLKPIESGATDPATGRDPRRWAALALLCVASFMMILDSQFVVLALPSIQSALEMSPEQVQWVITVNAITFGGLLLLGGRMADLIGRRKAFMIGVAGFLLTTMLSGLSWDAGTLVIARALHGVSSALMVPSALSILMNTFQEGPERNRAIAAWSAVGGVGAVGGLLVGGVLTTELGWQWAFLVNVPVVLCLLVVTPFVLRESRDSAQRRTFDVAGALTVTLALAALIYATVDGPVAGWASVRTIGLYVLAAALIALFVVIESRSSAPLVPLPILRKPTVLVGNLLMMLVAGIVWGEGLLISLHTQQVMGYSAFESGLVSAAMPVMSVAGAYVGQAMVTRRGFKLPMAVGAIGLGAACLLLTRLPIGANITTTIIVPLALFGLCLGIGHTTSNIVALTDVDEPESGLASGLISAGFQIGGAIGTAIAATVAVSVTAGSTEPADLAAGFEAGFVALAIMALLALLLAFALPAYTRRTGKRRAAAEARPAAG